MGLSTEKVANKPLSGRELAELIERDVKDVLMRDGMFSEYVAYGRVAYTVGIQVHTGNPTYPEHEVRIQPLPTVAVNGVEGVPPLKNNTDGGAGFDHLRRREVDSPNLSRIAAGMPISMHTSREGVPVITEVRYDAGEYPAPPTPVDVDNSNDPQWRTPQHNTTI